MGLVLAMDVAVGIADVDLTELCQQVDAHTVGGPQFGAALLAIANIGGKEGAPVVIGPALQGMKKCSVAGRHVLPHFL